MPPRTWIWPGVVALALIMGIVVFDAATSPDVSAADDKCHSAEQTAAGGVTECIAAFFTKAVSIGVNAFAVAALGTTLYMAVRRRRRFRPCPHCDRPMPAENQTCRRCGETSAGWSYSKGRWWTAGPQGSQVFFDDVQRNWVQPDAPNPP